MLREKYVLTAWQIIRIKATFSAKVRIYYSSSKNYRVITKKEKNVINKAIASKMIPPYWPVARVCPQKTNVDLHFLNLIEVDINRSKSPCFSILFSRYRRAKSELESPPSAIDNYVRLSLSKHHNKRKKSTKYLFPCIVHPTTYLVYLFVSERHKSPFRVQMQNSKFKFMLRRRKRQQHRTNQRTGWQAGVHARSIYLN